MAKMEGGIILFGINVQLRKLIGRSCLISEAALFGSLVLVAQVTHFDFLIISDR